MPQVAFSQRKLVQASLLVEHQPDTYPNLTPATRYAWREGNPELDGGRVSAVPSQTVASHAPETPTDAGQDGTSPGRTPPRCPLCQDRGTRRGPNGESWHCHCRANRRNAPGAPRGM